MERGEKAGEVGHEGDARAREWADEMCDTAIKNENAAGAIGTAYNEYM